MKNVLLSQCLLCFYVIISFLQCFEFISGSVEGHDFLVLARTSRQASETYDDGNCSIPQRPNFGRWIISGNSYGYSSQIASLLTVMRLSCDNGYLSTSKNDYIVCEGTKWSVSEMPTCLKKCGPFNKTTQVISIKCFDIDNTEIECDKATHATRASFKCTPYFASSEPISIDVYCYRGTWNVSEPVCPGCILPKHPRYGQWSILGDTLGQPSQITPFNTVLEFRCKDNLQLSSSSPYMFCGKTGWSHPEPPTCSKICQPLNSTKSTTIKCFSSRNIEIKCDEATDGGYASFECIPYFEPSDGTFSKRFCKEGTWNLPHPVCEPVCGEKTVSAQPLVVGGEVVEKGSLSISGKPVQKGNYPWVTAIYHRDDNSYMYACSGTMLTQKVILTVAQCVTDDKADLIPTEKIQVAVGKYYKNYKDLRDNHAQYSMVHKIIVPWRYKGETQSFSSDIAVLITTETLLLSKFVQPACYQGLPNQFLGTDDVGVVTGWGNTSAIGQPSEELKEIDVPYKMQTECAAEFPKDWFDKYYTFDKICTGYYNQSKYACTGDSGAGLYFKHNDRYYVHGVVSVGPSKKGECNLQVSILYTSVQKHSEWLEKITSMYS